MPPRSTSRSRAAQPWPQLAPTWLTGKERDVTVTKEWKVCKSAGADQAVEQERRSERDEERETGQWRLRNKCAAGGLAMIRDDGERVALEADPDSREKARRPPKTCFNHNVAG